MVEFLMFVLVSKPFKLVSRELMGVPWGMLLSTDVILLVGPIALWIGMLKNNTVLRMFPSLPK